MNLYTSLEAELHDPFWAAEESPEFEWLDTLLGRDPGAAIEIGSGSGRLLLPLLENGHAVEGLEPAPEMRALCLEAAAGRGLQPVLHPYSIADFSAAGPYHAVLVPAFTLQLSNRPADDLARLARMPRPGGWLYLTTFIPFAELHGELPENEWYPDHELTFPDGRHAALRTRHTLDRPGQILRRQHHYRLTTPGEPPREHHSRQVIRWFTAVQLRDQLADHGLEIKHAIADFDDSQPITDGSQILTLVARRPA